MSSYSHKIEPCRRWQCWWWRVWRCIKYLHDFLITFARWDNKYKRHVFVPSSYSSIISIYSNHSSQTVGPLLFLSLSMIGLKAVKIGLNQLGCRTFTAFEIWIFSSSRSSGRWKSFKSKDYSKSNIFFQSVWHCPYKDVGLNIFRLILWQFDLLWHRLHLGWGLMSLDDLNCRHQLLPEYQILN